MSENWRLEVDVDEWHEATAELTAPGGRRVAAVLVDGEGSASVPITPEELLAMAWVPIERTLPPPCQDVLIALEDDETGEHIIEAGWLHRDDRWRLLSATETVLYGHRRVTHWMPWPAHPAAVAQEQAADQSTTSATEGS